VLEAEPHNFHALHLLGLVAYQKGDLEQAKSLIGQAIRLRGDVPDFHANLGETLRAKGELDGAIASYTKALQLSPTMPEIRINLANALMDAGREAEAMEQYGQAAVDAGRDAEALWKMADGLERMNRLAGARSIVRHGLAVAPGDVKLILLDTRLDRREGLFHEGIGKLRDCAARAPELETTIECHTELGRLYDRAGDVDEALRMFEAAGRHKAELFRSQGITKAFGLDMIGRMEAMMTPDKVAGWRNVVGQGEMGRPAPVFLIGFPRSGTTLLEQVLASHTGIVTLEEKPTVDMMAGLVEAKYAAYPEGLDHLTEEDVHALRQRYFQYVDSLVKVAPGQTFVDKLPLNLVHVPLLARVFPDARFIVALRHPADVVLSGYMQSFKPNSAMANFCTLEDAAHFYDRVMGLWRRCADMLPIAWHAVKYEDMVEDFDGEVKRLLDFLGLPWEETVRQYHETSRKGKVINTPSYHQVAEPIYRRAKERWRRYEPHLRPVMPILAPWATYFGYADEETR
jgi:tetratricopeptide (TPR) repeat protein